MFSHRNILATNVVDLWSRAGSSVKYTTKGTKTDDVLKNIVYVELYNVDMCD